MQTIEFLCFNILILLSVNKNKTKGNAMTITIDGLIVNKKIEIIEMLKKFSKLIFLIFSIFKIIKIKMKKNIFAGASWFYSIRTSPNPKSQSLQLEYK